MLPTKEGALTVTTTLKLPLELKKRIGPLALKSGKTPHAWMLEALQRQAELADLREAFIQDALDSATEVDEGGPLFAAEDVHAYLAARAAGKRARRPKPLKKASRPDRR